MDEKDKMLRQMVYNANDAVLNEDRMKCKDLCYDPKRRNHKKNFGENKGYIYNYGTFLV